MLRGLLELRVIAVGDGDQNRVLRPDSDRSNQELAPHFERAHFVSSLWDGHSAVQLLKLCAFKRLCDACRQTASCERCTPSARCGSCRNVQSSLHRRSGLKAVRGGRPFAGLAESSGTLRLDLPRTRDGLNYYCHLVAAETDDATPLRCLSAAARAPVPTCLCSQPIRARPFAGSGAATGGCTTRRASISS